MAVYVDPAIRSWRGKKWITSRIQPKEGSTNMLIAFNLSNDPEYSYGIAQIDSKDLTEIQSVLEWAKTAPIPLQSLSIEIGTLSVTSSAVLPQWVLTELDHHPHLVIKDRSKCQEIEVSLSTITSTVNSDELVTATLSSCVIETIPIPTIQWSFYTSPHDDTEQTSGSINLSELIQSHDILPSNPI